MAGSKSKFLKRLLYSAVIIAANAVMDAGHAHGLVDFLETVTRVYAAYLRQLHLIYFPKRTGNENDTGIFEISYNMEDGNNHYPVDEPQ